MKKTLITLLALAGVAAGQDSVWTALTLDGGSGNSGCEISTVNGITSVTKGQASVNWTEEGYSTLTSWKISFTLTDSTIAAASIWSTNNSSNDPRGMVLSVSEQGALVLGGKGANPSFVSTANGVVSANTPTTITLQFIANEADEYYGFTTTERRPEPS